MALLLTFPSRIDLMCGYALGHLLPQFKNLRSLRVPCYTWLKYLENLPIQELIVSNIYTWPVTIWDREPWGVVPVLPRLESLRLMYDQGRSAPHEPPLVDLQNFQLLKRIQFSGSQAWENKDIFPGVVNSLQDLAFTGHFATPQAGPWLEPFSHSIQRLFIDRLSTPGPSVALLFPTLKVLEVHWCRPDIFQGSLFPALTHLSISTELLDTYKSLTGIKILQAFKECSLRLVTLIIRGRCEPGHRHPHKYLMGGEDVNFIKSATAKGALMNLGIEGDLDVAGRDWALMVPLNSCRVLPDHGGSEDRKKSQRWERQIMLTQLDPSNLFWESETGLETNSLDDGASHGGGD
jgi:hypothetical protein